MWRKKRLKGKEVVPEVGVVVPDEADPWLGESPVGDSPLAPQAEADPGQEGEEWAAEKIETIQEEEEVVEEGAFLARDVDLLFNGA